MSRDLRGLGARLRNSVWLLPALWVVLAAVLALVLVGLSATLPDLDRRFPRLFGGGPDGARTLLSTIAASAITVAGVTFSITIVALQLASTQFSPRVLRNFMRDRSSQNVLGALIATFFYSLLVLRSIRAEDDPRPAFVPSLAVTMAIVLAGVTVALFIYFIHHISRSIQVSTIVASIAAETCGAIERSWREPGGPDAVEEAETGAPTGEPGRVGAVRSGYLQLVDEEGLLEVASERDLVVRVDGRAGDWVQSGATVFSVWPASAAGPELARRLDGHLTLGAERSLRQDAAFGIRQLVDVAVKALSPGINDPTSARDCIHRLTQILVTVGNHRAPRVVHDDAAGRRRLIVRQREFRDYVELAFDEIRHHGGTAPAIVLALGDALTTISALVPPRRRECLERQMERLRESSSRIEPEPERRRVLEALSLARASRA